MEEPKTAKEILQRNWESLDRQCAALRLVIKSNDEDSTKRLDSLQIYTALMADIKASMAKL